MSDHINLENLDLVEQYEDFRRGPTGVYLDDNGNVYIDVGAGPPRPATLRYALEWMADKHDVDEMSSRHCFERFFRLVAGHLPE